MRQAGTVPVVQGKSVTYQGDQETEDDMSNINVGDMGQNGVMTRSEPRASGPIGKNPIAHGRS